jgi:excisionase family DNA binding protein
MTALLHRARRVGYGDRLGQRVAHQSLRKYVFQELDCYCHPARRSAESVPMTTSNGQRRVDDFDLVTLPEAARRIGVGERQLRQAIERGALSFYEIGGWTRIRWSEAVAWVEGQRRQHGTTNKAAP